MTGPTLLDEYLDAALPVEPMTGPHPAADEIARLIDDLRPTLRSTLEQFHIPPAEAWSVLQPMVAYAVLHWGETLDPAPWLLAVLRHCCREHRSRAAEPPACDPAPAGDRILPEQEEAGTARLSAGHRP